MNDSTRQFLTSAARGKLGGIEAGIASGQDVNASNDEGWTALHFAAALANAPMV